MSASVAASAAASLSASVAASAAALCLLSAPAAALSLLSAPAAAVAVVVCILFLTPLPWSYSCTAVQLFTAIGVVLLLYSR